MEEETARKAWGTVGEWIRGGGKKRKGKEKKEEEKKRKEKNMKRTI